MHFTKRRIKSTPSPAVACSAGFQHRRGLSSPEVGLLLHVTSIDIPLFLLSWQLVGLIIYWIIISISISSTLPSLHRNGRASDDATVVTRPLRIVSTVAISLHSPLLPLAGYDTVEALRPCCRFAILLTAWMQHRSALFCFYTCRNVLV